MKEFAALTTSESLSRYTGYMPTEECCSKGPGRGKEQRVRRWPRKETVRTGTREEVARFQGTVPSSFTLTAETNEQLRDNEKKRKTARDRDPRTRERKEQCQLLAVTCVRGQYGTFFASFNGEVQCTTDYTGKKAHKMCGVT